MATSEENIKLDLTKKQIIALGGTDTTGVTGPATGTAIDLSPEGLYQWVSEIPIEDSVLYGVILLVSVIFINTLQLSSNTIIGLFAGCFVVYFLIDRQRTKGTNTMVTLETKMASLVPVPKYFFINSNFIELMYSLLEFSQYSPEDYGNCVQHIDNVLKLSLDLENEMEDCVNVLDVIKDESVAAVDSLSNLIVSIPGGASGILLKNKLVTGISTLQLYLLRQLDECKVLCEHYRELA
jgi:hypothetical protein